MKRIFFLNRFFPPDYSATSQLVGDLAVHLAAAGHDVHVVTSQQLYDQPQARLAAAELLDGVHIHRVPTTRFGRSNLVGRALDYVSFYALARRSLLKLVKRHDIVVAMTDPPLISIVAMHVARRRGAHLVNWLQDIYPELAVELRVPLIKGPLLRLLRHLRNRSSKMAVANVVVGQLMADKIASQGLSRERIHVIANWTDDEHIVPIAPEDNFLRREWGLQNKFVFGYSGNLGRAHEFDTVLAAAEQLRDNPDIVFLFIGGGHQIGKLTQLVMERGLANFRFVDYQDRANLKYSLGVPDAHWISLRPELEGLIVPSKFYGIAAAGRPAIAICSINGEIARLVREHQCGVVIEPGNAQALADTLLRLSTDVDRRATMGQRARAMLDAHFTRDLALTRWQQVLQQSPAKPKNS